MNSQSPKKFGTIAVEKGFVTQKQLMHALSIQARENISKDRHRMIGQILLEEHYITESQIQEVLNIIDYQMVYILSVGR